MACAPVILGLRSLDEEQLKQKEVREEPMKAQKEGINASTGSLTDEPLQEQAKRLSPIEQGQSRREKVSASFL
jgi:hypothetical protein